MKPVLQLFPEYGSKTCFRWQILAVLPFDKPGESKILQQGTAWTPEQATKDASTAFVKIIKERK